MIIVISLLRTPVTKLLMIDHDMTADGAVRYSNSQRGSA